MGVEGRSWDIVVGRLVQPASFWRQLLAHSATFPVYSDSSARSHEAETWVSNGPFTLSRWRPGTSLELNRNDTYWDHANVKLERVSYQISPDQNSQFAAYRAGQLDITDTVPPNAIASIREERPHELVIAPYLATAYYGLNFASPSLNGNLSLRKALSMPIDRHRLVAALGLAQLSAYGFVPPGTWNDDPQRWEWKTLTNSHRLPEPRSSYNKPGYSPPP